MLRKAFIAVSWLAALAAAVLGALHGITQADTTSSIAVVAVVGSICAVLIGSFAHKPPFVVSVTAVFSIVVITASRVVENQSTSGTSPLVELLLLASQAALVFGLLLIVRQRLLGQLANVLTDGIIVGLGAWVLVWIFLIQPSLALTGNTPAITAVQSATLGVAMIVLFLLATLLFSNTAPSAPVAFLGLSVALGLTGIILRSVIVRSDAHLSSSTVNASFLIAFALAGASFLHPNIRHINSGTISRATAPLMTRLMTTTVSLIAPIIVLAITDPHDSTDRWVRTVSVIVLAAAVMLRVIQSVRLNASTQDTLVRNALTDSLTGLPNRILMLEHIEKAIHSSWKTSQRPTVLFIDVDRFKSINDSLGHSTGDAILTEVARRLTGAIAPHATVARIAGDEFVVLDSTTESPTQSVLLAEKILDALRDPMKGNSGDMFVTASIGVAYAVPNLRLSAEDLMQHADTAMYRAKSAGRNCIALFDDSMLESVTKRLDVETALYRALERNELRLVHQPIVDIDLGIVIGFEALMRWDRKDAGTVSPLDFIPIAEETGTIVPLGSWAINDALQQLRSWVDTGVCTPNTTMSVNVSPRQLHDPEFVTIVSNALDASGVSPEQLWLEVTESVMITEPTQALSSLRRLNALGVRIAIDDFGTGYSSLSLLQKFPIQCIKIDRAFVNDISTDKATQNIVRTIIAMADAMGADIVAEGVEDKTQLHTLKSVNCHRAQGYLISPPVDVQDVPRVVREIEDPESWASRTN
jgi:diguanylate cyclase (GGDEF)-like protein